MSNSWVTHMDRLTAAERYAKLKLITLALGLFPTLGCAHRHSPTRSQPGTVAARGFNCSPIRASGDAPLVDDFGSDPRKILGNEGRQGWWFSYDDGTSGHLLRESIELNSSTGRVLHVTSSGFAKWGSGFGVVMHPLSSQSRACPYDASVYRGVRFRARGSGRLRLMLGDVASTPKSRGGACSRTGARCEDRPGAWVNLEPEWKTFEFPFCTFVPEGWGGSTEGVDPSKLVSIHFQAGPREAIEMWLDDLAFYRAEAGAPAPRCGIPCPLEAMPRTAKIEPSSLMGKPSPGLSVRTFVQATRSCGPLTRRYLSYVPARLEPRSSAPVLIMLHGASTNAETARTYQTHDRFEALAERDGFIVVYPNAAPGSDSSPDPDFPNTGVWRQGYFDDGQVDDVEYLTQVIGDLVTRGVISGNNPMFAVGISNGGGMVLEAARRMPNRFQGIAAFMPYDGEHPKPVPDLSATKLKRFLLAYAINDPGLSDRYHETLARLPAQWAAAMGMPAAVIAAPRKSELPNLVAEGASYRGTSKVALATRDSHVTEADLLGPDGIGQVRVLVLDHAGHFWPNPIEDKEAFILDRWGFRNQDFDAADMAWEFMKPAANAH